MEEKKHKAKKHKIKIKFGDKVTCHRKYERHYDIDMNDLKSNESIVYWKEENHYIKGGIFLGVRYLKNGKVLHYREDGSLFKITEVIQCALVSPNKTMNAIYVPIDSIPENI